MPATFPVWIVTATIALFLCRTTTVTCEFPMTLSLDRAIPTNNVTKLKTFDHARHRLRSLIQSSSDAGFSLEGTYDPYVGGLYYTKVQLGSPARDFHLQVDTGSDPLWVTCNTCLGCPNATKLPITLSSFDPEKSSTDKPLTCSDALCNSEVQSADATCSQNVNRCTFQFEYADGSGAFGHYVTDLIHFSTPAISDGSSPIIFGCSTMVTGNLETNERAVDGILGLAQGKISVLSQLSSKGLVPNVFSHCLRGDGQGGGTLVLGEVVEPNMVYTPLIPVSGSHYNVDLKGIDVQGQALAIDSSVFQTTETQGTVVDSGTTLTYVPNGVYEVLFKAITALIPEGSFTGMGTYNSNGGQCFFLVKSISEVFPNVTLNFAGGASMLLQPKDYLVNHMTFIDGEKGWCMGILKSGSDQGLTILGDNILKDRIIVYDLDGQRVGWTDYDCSTPFNVSTAKPNSARKSRASGGAASRDWPHKTGTLAFFVSLICFFSCFFSI